MIGIYMIKNKINGRVYIGQSSNIKKRWRTHVQDLNSQTHHNQKLQRAWNKYGPGGFDFIIIEECPVDELDKKERFYIEIFDAYKTGYNLTSGGRINSLEEKIIYQYTQNFDLVKIWTSALELRKNGYIPERVHVVCRHQHMQKRYKGYIWAYEGYDFSDGYFDGILDNRVKTNQERSIPILKIDKMGNILQIYESLSAAAKSLDTSSTGNKIAKAANKHYQYKGFENDLWFKDDNQRNIALTTRKSNDPRVVIKCDQNMNEIEIYSSLTEAGIKNNTIPSNIIRAIKNNTTAGGFKWKYKT